jgi:deferrochelatase/peroxidase EfeB
MPVFTRRVALAALGLAVAAATAAGCGSGDDAPATNPPAAKLEQRVPVSGTIPHARPADFVAPTARYRRYVRAELGAMLPELARLRAAIAAGDLAAARRAWLAADARYEAIGAAYGAFGELDAAINATTAGLQGGVRSPDFTGLHRVELALWERRSTADASAPAARLEGDVRRLRAHVAGLQIDPLEYTLRAHEVLEGSLDLQLSGSASPWSGSALVALDANVRGTSVVLGTLAPMIGRRNPQVLAGARASLTRLRRALHGLRGPDGTLPRWNALPQREHERIAGLTAAAAGRLAGGASPAGAAEAPSAGVSPETFPVQVPFDGAHQAGVLTPRPPYALVVAFDAIADTRAQLTDTLATLSERARANAHGYDALLGAPGGEGPTPDSGVLGPRVTPDGLTVTIGFGASLFDGRYGLAARKPDGLKAMPVFPDDAVDPAQSHGDVLVQLCANTQEKLLHTLRDLMRATRDGLAPRWKLEGFLPPPQREQGAGRNLLGFKDGTANPDTDDEALMRELVWTPDGGTYAVVRVIRNRVEFWDRVARTEQELMIGRDKASGAPLGRRDEFDDPGYGEDPRGDRIPLDAHIRLARPRTPTSEGSRIVRRGYNYSRGVDDAGQLDMGLLFVAFNRSLERQFEAVQKRLAGEPLVDYVVPTGGGYFYLPPGARDAQDWVGSGLFV